MADFVAALDPINALADRSPGFVWRLQGEGGDATSIRVTDDPRVLWNMSVWTGVEALEDYVYRSEHLTPMKRRKEWFDGAPDGMPSLALWWIPAGELPTSEEGLARLRLLAERGPTPEAFTFRDRFDPPAGVE